MLAKRLSLQHYLFQMDKISNEKNLMSYLKNPVGKQRSTE